VIKSYGIHWHSDRVDWGRPGPNNEGTLLGGRSPSPRTNPVDFREQSGIYALYADYDLVYIGQTGAGRSRLFNRLKSHRFGHLSERWNRFSWFGVRRVTKNHSLAKDAVAANVPIKDALNIMEAVSIAIAEPRLNLQRGRWVSVTRYFQYWDREDEESE